MGKRCIICSEEAVYKIKDTSDFYCEECAQENFSDLSLLIKVEEEARRLREFLKDKMEDLLMDERELDQMIVIREKKDGHEHKTGEDQDF